EGVEVVRSDLAKPVEGGGLEDLLLPAVDEGRALLCPTEARHDVRLGVRDVGARDVAGATDDLPRRRGEGVRRARHRRQKRQVLGGGELLDNTPQDQRLQERNLSHVPQSPLCWIGSLSSMEIFSPSTCAPSSGESHLAGLV